MFTTNYPNGALCAKPLLKAMMLIAFLFSICGTSISQPKVRIALTHPALNQLTLKDMYACKVENLTDETIIVHLEGFMKEANAGEIVSGKTGEFELKGKEKKTFNTGNVPKGGEYKWTNNKFKGVMLQTGMAPEGTYTICLSAIDVQGVVVGQENCIEQTVKLEGSISLIEPTNDAVIDPDTIGNITFMWTPWQGAKEYTLTMVEVKEGMSPEAAMKNIKPFYVKEGITGTTFNYRYGINEPGPTGPKTGVKIAWQITSGKVESEVWSLILVGGQEKLPSTVLENCGMERALDLAQARDSTYMQRIEEMEKESYNYLYGGQRNAILEQQYCIPVVVHIIHNNGAENIADQQVYDAIQRLNEDFRKIPSTPGFGNGVDTRINFRLATRDPNGNPTTGIVRVQSINTIAIFDGGGPGELALKNASRWPNDRYLNIWIVRCIVGGLPQQCYPLSVGQCLGWAWYGVSLTTPSALGNLMDGIVVRHDKFGRTGTSSGNVTRTLTHEAGHWLWLAHTFGFSWSNPGCFSGVEYGSAPSNTSIIPNCATKGDFCCDTPPQIQHFQCTPPPNTCALESPNNVDPYKNYLSYSHGCQNEFTANQRDRMHFWLNQHRIQIWSPGNLVSTGITCADTKTNCCEGFVKKVENPDVVKDNLGNINFTASITAGPLRIKKVTAEMVYFYQRWGDTNCTKCVNNNSLMGNFTGGTLGGFGAGSLNAPPFVSGYSREITFSSAGVSMTTAQAINLNLSLPPASSLSCCGDTIRLCIRFSFTDTACVTCDTVICRKIVRTNTGITNTAGGEKMNSDEIILLNNDETEVVPEITESGESGSQPPGYNVSFTPTGDGCCFNVTVTNTSGYTGWNSFQINSATNPIISVSPVNSTTNPSVVPPNVSMLTWIRSTGGFPAGTSSYGTVCFNNTTTPFPITIRWSTNSGAAFMNWDEEDMLSCIGTSKIPPDHCCDNFDINITSTILVRWSSLPNLYSFNANVTTGLNRIKKVRAFMTHFSQTYSNPDCQQCVKNPTQWGSIGSFGSIGALTPTWTNPYSTPLLEYTNWREIIWQNASGQTVPPLNNQSIPFVMMLPDRPILSCCSDTIKFCIKYEFTDTTCVTCDTTICYQYVLSGPNNSGLKLRTINPTQQELKLLPKELREKIEKYDKSPRSQGESGYDNNSNKNIESLEQVVLNTHGEDITTIGVIFDKSSQVKVTLFDASGNKIVDIIDKRLKKGKHNINLSEYNLPDGVYYYKSEYNDKTEYNKILVSKPVSGCNCGH